MLEIKNLRVKINEKEILKGLDLKIGENQVHALMGPNGSGKSTLASTLMGHPGYEVVSGAAIFNNENILEMEANERAEKGLFLSFQYPSEVEGVNIASYLRMIYNKADEQKLSPIKFREVLKEKMEILDIKEEFINRYLNDGFSGGEKKRMEMLQMLILEPKLAQMSVVVITHYTRILNYIKPEFVHVLKDGKIIKEGGESLAHEIEVSGYAPFEN